MAQIETSSPSYLQYMYQATTYVNVPKMGSAELALVTNKKSTTHMEFVDLALVTDNKSVTPL